MSGHRRPTCWTDEPCHYPPTHPFGVDERVLYVKSIVKVNYKRGITKDGPLVVNWVLSPGTRRHTGRTQGVLPDSRVHKEYLFLS